MTLSLSKKDKLIDLQKKISLAKKKDNISKSSRTGHKNASYVWRMVLELVIGMFLGFGIGYGLDQLFGTAPLLIVIMSLFGFGAGVRTMMKTAAEFVKIEKNDRVKEREPFER